MPSRFNSIRGAGFAQPGQRRRPSFFNASQAATSNGARTLAEPKGLAPSFGIVRPGMSADLVIAPENPLANFKTLYGTGHQRLSPDNRIETVGGVKWTVTRGVAYDAPALLADVKAMVEAKKAERAAAR